LPAARPERSLTADYVWSDLAAKSGAALRHAVREHAGRRLSLERIRFAGGTTQYRTYLVHRNAVVTIRDGAGAPQDLRLFGSVIERSGRFKIFSYVVD